MPICGAAGPTDQARCPPAGPPVSAGFSLSPWGVATEVQQAEIKVTVFPVAQVRTHAKDVPQIATHPNPVQALFPALFPRALGKLELCPFCALPAGLNEGLQASLLA